VLLVVTVAAGSEVSARRALRDARGRLAHGNVPASYEQRRGDPADELVAAATELGATLAVIGHSDRGALARLVPSAVAVELLRRAPCDLLIVR
jgi:nucleotide-binding universal stress UspA family protein